MDDSLKGIAIVVGSIAAIVTGFTIVWRKAIKPFFHGTKEFIQGIIRISNATPILIGIAEQFRPNAGGSLRDVVNNVQAKVDKIDEDQELLTIEFKRHVVQDKESFAEIRSNQKELKENNVLSNVSMKRIQEAVDPDLV